MKIAQTILNRILDDMPLQPPEEGGIIGGKEGKVICWIHDKGSDEYGCRYSPNTDKLNESIGSWMENGYEFMGIVHAHFGNSRLLSEGDKKYIERIVKAMPSFIDKLYFPLVIQPEKEMISYVAIRNGDKVAIRQDQILVVKDS